tara:strand:+ start:6392 stop:7486 length:1095 start_codon:yes stop_codon:yes gene_type:complete
MQKIIVDLGDRSYPIFIGSGLLSQSHLIPMNINEGRVVIVTNTVVSPLYLEKAKSFFSDRSCSHVVLQDGESFKTLETINVIYKFLLEGKYDRKTTLVALGGGVVGDITGFVAATYLRGIDFVQVPTTLLSQVDSSVGGKTGVNHELGKNMIGAFYQPRCVIADTSVLSTLPQRELKAGFAEVLKYGLINDLDFFEWLDSNSSELLQKEPALMTSVIKRSCEIKAEIVAKDEREAGTRALLNFGHTFGHAIEAAMGFGNVLHGEAVAMGMVMAADLSLRVGWISSSEAFRVRQVLENNFQLNIVPPDKISVEQFLEFMASDKKIENNILKFILLHAIGDAGISSEIPINLLRATLGARTSLCED